MISRATLAALSPVTRRNLLLETLSGLSQGTLGGLVLLAQVAVIGSLKDKGWAATVMLAAMPATQLLQPLWAELGRRLRFQHMAVAAGALRCLPLLAVGWVEQPWLFALCIVAYYLVTGPNTLATNSLYKLTYPDSHRGRILGWFRFVQNAVSVLVMLGGSAWLDREPMAFQLIFPLGAVLGLWGQFAYRRLVIVGDDPARRRTFAERPSPATLRRILREDAPFRLFQTTIFLTGAGFLMSRSVLLYLLRDEFHLSQFEMSLLVMVLPLVLGGLTAPAWGLLIDRTSPIAGRVGFALLGLFSYLSFFGSFHFGLLGLVYVGAMVRGLVLGAAEVATTTGNLYFADRPERAALYESISSVFQGVRGLSMPFLGWLLFQWLAAGLFLGAAGLNCWSLVLALRLWKLDEADRANRAHAQLQDRLDSLAEEAEDSSLHGL